MNKAINIFILIICSFTFSPINAQDLNTIRNQYYNTKEYISRQSVEENNKNSGELNITHNVPGIGLQTYNCTFYFTPYQYDEEGFLKIHTLQFMQCRFNVAARNYYEEYLYDEKGNVIFIYGKEPKLENQNDFREIRLYFSNNKLIKIISSEPTNENNDEDFYQKEAISRAKSFMPIFANINKFIGCND